MALILAVTSKHWNFGPETWLTKVLLFYLCYQHNCIISTKSFHNNSSNFSSLFQLAKVTLNKQLCSTCFKSSNQKLEKFLMYKEKNIFKNCSVQMLEILPDRCRKVASQSQRLLRNN